MPGREKMYETLVLYGVMLVQVVEWRRILLAPPVHHQQNDLSYCGSRSQI